MKKSILENTIGTSFGLAGLGIGLGVMGEAFESEGLKSAGSTATGFIPIAINVGMAATTINMLKDFKKI